MTIALPDTIRSFDSLHDLYQAQESSEGNFVDATTVLDSRFSSYEAIVNWAQGMVERGYLEEESTLSTFEVTLTSEGRAVVQGGMSKRSDVSLYRDTVRRRLLKWVYEHSTGASDKADVDFTAEESWFYGRVISLDDLGRAAVELEKNHLVTQKPLETWGDGLVKLLVGITVEGQECVEEFDCDIKLHIKSKDRPSMSGPVINIGTMNGGVFAVGNHNDLSSTVGDENARQIIQLGTAIRDALPILQLQPEVEIATDAHLEALISGEDSSKAKIALEWLKDMFSSTASGALGEIFAGQISAILTSVSG